MNNDDIIISKLYKETYGGAHASAELKGTVRTMTNEGKKRAKVSVKIICAVAAAAVLATAGGAIAHASKGYRYEGVYDDIIFNGETRKAKYGDFGNDVRTWQFDDNGASYAIFINGEYDENDTLYVVDCGDYFLASTDPNPTLNLYDEIDNTDRADLIERDGMTCLAIYRNEPNEISPYHSVTGFSFPEADEADGAKDGKLYLTPGDVNSGTDVYAILPNGSVVETIKEYPDGEYAEEEDDQAVDIWNNIWGGMGSPEIESD